MATLNHHIVAARDSEASARYYCEILGLGPAVKLGHFAVIDVGAGATLDFLDDDTDFDRQHYAFLVTESEFDEVLDRVRQRDQPYWSDPMHQDPGKVNAWDGGRGVYFDDPDGHRLEILTRPYGSGGTEAERVHPLIAPPIEGTDPRLDVH
jgi:catechol 2,3-dioxygenase-like lactoylglutathione lyase family enzyme